MINFHVVDFSKCRSEEVISFFWRSVYITLQVGLRGCEAVLINGEDFYCNLLLKG